MLLLALLDPVLQAIDGDHFRQVGVGQSPPLEPGKPGAGTLVSKVPVSVQGGTGPGRYPLATALSGSKVGAGLPQLAASQASVR